MKTIWSNNLKDNFGQSYTGPAIKFEEEDLKLFNELHGYSDKNKLIKFFILFFNKEKVFYYFQSKYGSAFDTISSEKNHLFVLILKVIKKSGFKI